MKEKRAVIIGGGLGGLTAAIRLAALGINVTVCERGATLGGKMNHRILNGYKFDTGPSLITMPWVFEEVFEVAGSKMSDHLEMIPMHPLSRYSFADGTKFTYTANMAEWLETVRAIEPKDVDGFLRFMKLGAKLYELSKDSFMRRPPFGLPQAGDAATLRHFPLRHAWGNYAKAVAAHFQSPHLRQLYNRYPTYVGSSPYATPATLLVIPYLEYLFNGWYPKGGLYRIVESFVLLAKQLGVTLLTNAPVKSIEHRNRKVCAVKLEDDQTIDADFVVANCEADDAKVLLGEPAAQRLPASERSMSGLVFLLGIKWDMPELTHHQIYFSADYQTEFAQIFNERRFPDDPTVYVNCPSRNDRSIVPGAGEALFVMANAPANDGNEWDANMIAAARQRVFQRLHANGFPNIQQDIVVEDVWTPNRIASQYAMPGGAIYGKHSHSWRTAFLRPPNKDRNYAGLYYVGGSTHPGGGTPTVILSSLITTNLIRQYELAA